MTFMDVYIDLIKTQIVEMCDKQKAYYRITECYNLEKWLYQGALSGIFVCSYCKNKHRGSRIVGVVEL